MRNETRRGLTRAGQILLAMALVALGTVWWDGPTMASPIAYLSALLVH